MKGTTPYAELHCLSPFSFGRGASTADELFERAKKLHYTALAITDECSLAGIVRAFEASNKHGIPLIVGSEFLLDDGLKLVVLVEDHAGYSGLCALITKARRRAVKGNYHVTRADFADGLPGCVALWCPGAPIDAEAGAWMRATFTDRVWLAVELHRGPDDAARLATLLQTAEQLQIPAVACGDVHMHVRRRRALQDVLTALRYRLSVAEAGAYLFANGERHLRTLPALQQIYPEALIAETQRIAARCGFRMDQLNYRYPRELVPEDHTPASWLRTLTEAGMARRWPEGVLPRVRRQIESELVLIAELQYEAFFLTVEDVVRFARSRGILCQGRGSSANSAVCFALGITEVDPARMNLLFGRFLSKERNEPPDIDVDFEHDRREEVIQYLYAKYGRERAALAATVICYRGKSAVRDVARALGLPPDLIDQLSRAFAWWNGESDPAERVRERGFDPESPVLRRVLALTRELLDMPRHLSQHVGGFVIADAPLSSLVPVENATMPERTIIQWDKDDLETLGLLKVDVLALGMLSAVRRCFALVEKHRGYPLTMATVPAEDEPTYAMIQRADTVGVFQIESRAQMAMLPRLKPATFYDLVIEVAIVRPGPIQGNMVHPYLRRRQQQEPISYPSEGMREVLGRTLGVPLFQEQVMQLAIVAADFSAGEADALRRGMAAWKRHGGLEHFRNRLFSGMARNGYPEALAEQLFEQIKGFGSYGFPESHAASFALITYVSCWLKCHEPAAFTCALLNSQPMGFYAPSQLIQDGRRHGVVVRPVDVRHSDWDSTLEPAPSSTVSDPADHGRSGVQEAQAAYRGDTRRVAGPSSTDPTRRDGQPAIRLGLREIAGLAEDAALRIMDARASAPFDDVADLCLRAELDQRARSLLAEAGALRGLAGHRHRARWAVAGVEAQLPLFSASPKEDTVTLRVPTAGEDLNADFARLGHTLGPHPIQLLRRQLQARRYRRSRDLEQMPHGRPVRVAGLVTGRQRPQTATGVTFVTLEDEDGMVNVVVWRDLGDRQRRVLIESRLLGVAGRLETVDGVRHLIAGRLFDESDLLGGLTTRSRDFH